MSIWCRTCISFHSICRDVDLVWLFTTLREIGSVFFLAFLHWHLYATGILTDKPVPFFPPLLQSTPPRFHVSLLHNLCIYLSGTSHAVSVLLWNLFILFFFTRCLSIWLCSRNRHKAMCSVRHLIILRLWEMERESERVGYLGYSCALSVNSWSYTDTVAHFHPGQRHRNPYDPPLKWNLRREQLCLYKHTVEGQ